MHLNDDGMNFQLCTTPYYDSAGLRPVLNNSAGVPYGIDTMHEGVKAWSDRAYTYGKVPAALLNGFVFQGPHKSLPRGTSINVTSPFDGTVYVFYESGLGRHGGYETALKTQGWTQEADGPDWVDTSGVGHDMDMFSKSTATGVFKLPPTATAQTVFGIAVVPSSRQHMNDTASAASSAGTHLDDKNLVSLVERLKYDGLTGCGGFPSGQSAFASSSYRSQPCRAFDQGLTRWESEWISKVGDTKGFVGYDFGPGRRVSVTAYSLQAANFAATDVPRTPILWVLEGSQDTKTWVIVDNTHSTVREAKWTRGLQRLYYVPVAQVARYRAFRVRSLGVEAGATYMQYSQIQFFTESSDASDFCYAAGSGRCFTTGASCQRGPHALVQNVSLWVRPKILAPATVSANRRVLHKTRRQLQMFPGLSGTDKKCGFSMFQKRTVVLNQICCPTTTVAAAQCHNGIPQICTAKCAVVITRAPTIWAQKSVFESQKYAESKIAERGLRPKTTAEQSRLYILCLKF